MNHLVVYCHPCPSSFNKAIADTVEAVSNALGHDTQCRDLYGIGFDPVFRRSDFEMIAKGHPRRDVQQEQEYIRWASMLTLVYPIWWTGMPALLKGYIDRVLCREFAYSINEAGVQGLLSGKNVLIFNTTGTPSDVYAESGMHDAISMTSDTGIFEFCGMKVLHHAFFGAVPTVDDAARTSYLTEVEAITSRYL